MYIFQVLRPLDSKKPDLIKGGSNLAIDRNGPGYEELNDFICEFEVLSREMSEHMHTRLKEYKDEII